MSTSKSRIQEWFERGVAQKKRYMIVVYDSFDHEDYPVFTTEVTYESEYKSHDGQNMQRIMEVYDLKKPMKAQLDAPRVWNGP